MMARQFCRLGEVHSLVYGCRESGENGRKLAASTRVGSESRLMDYLGFNLTKVNSASCLMMKYTQTLVLLLVCALLSTGCATMHPGEQNNDSIESSEKRDPIDPNEKTNRKFYDFTDMVDRNVLAPVADVYIKYVPAPMQRSIGNFYDNLAYPNVILNDFLQGKIRQGFQDSLRFVINSTIGGAGFFDMAGPMGLPQHDEDFGQTLGVWGVGTGSYLFVPLIGPSSYRDAPAIPVSFFSNVLLYAGSFAGGAVMAPITVLGIIDKRARLSGPMRVRDQAALDPYLFVREGFLQQRKHLIYDGNPPVESYDDSVLDDAAANEPPASPVSKPLN